MEYEIILYCEHDLEHVVGYVYEGAYRPETRFEPAEYPEPVICWVEGPDGCHIPEHLIFDKIWDGRQEELWDHIHGEM